MTLIILSLLSLPLMAICYFWSRLYLCIMFSLIFFISNIMLAHGLLYEHYVISFYLLMLLCVVFPISCLIAFALDVRYGIFCIDTSFSLVVVWIFSPILLPINIIILCLEN